MESNDVIQLTPRKSDVFLLMSDITQETCAEAIMWILEQNQTKEYDSLTLMICSQGGDLSAAMALIDVMNMSEIPVATLGLGLVASAALMILMAGAVDSRYITRNTTLMSHQYSSSTGITKHHDLMASMKEFDIGIKMMCDHYVTMTGLDSDTVMEKLLPPSDIWLTPDEALEYGIVDNII